MDLQPPDLPDTYPSFDSLIEAINTFASLQGYALVKKRTKVSKKGVLRKAILMCDRSKEHITENWCKKEDTTTQKTDCPFDSVTLLKVDGWTFQIQNGSHNHEATLPGAHPTHRKTARTKEVLESIANHVKTGDPPQQTLTHLSLTQDPEKPFFKNQDIYNEQQRLRQQTWMD